ncbi:response regulator [Cohnella sp.]|uniref:response regulator n=1 Tax=Cohnella sp. TaxID=1883426 RepID=UPI003562DD3A
MKLLIADDQMSLHTYLDKVIEWRALGITQVKHAYNGKEAADIAMEFMPDLLIIDIRMPELNGIDALRLIQSLPRKPKTVILSAFDEFEYARDALRLSVAYYLLKPVDAEQLIGTLRELIREIQSELQAAVERKLEKAGYKSDYSDICLDVIGAAFETIGITHYAVSSVRGNLPAGIAKELFSWASDSVIPYSFLLKEGSGEYIFLLGFKEELLQEQWLEWCELRIIHWRVSHPEWEAAMGISKVGTKLEALPLRVTESIQCSKLSFYVSDAVIGFREAPISGDTDLWMFHEMEKAFEGKARGGYQSEAIEGSIKDLFDQMRSRRPEPEFVYGVCHRLLFILTHAFNREMQQTPNVPSILELKQFRRFDNLRRYVYGKVDLFLLDTFGNSGKQFEVMRRIKSYIEAHCEMDLSLQTVADHFSIDKYRLSREFKQEAGENYWQFVTRIRMEQAAAFLKETNWKNSKIAERTGYMDESHFSRAFKKHYGLSPKDFRGKQEEG